VFALALVAAIPSPGPDKTPFMAESDAAVARMMAAMKIKPSGDVDHDFVAMMVPHHQGAVDMAEAELRYGHNERLRRISQEIVVTQEEEIATMRLALAGDTAPRSTGSEDAEFLAKTEPAMARMMAAMEIKPSGDVDHDFVAMMVPHHQGAVNMAEAELAYGHSEPLRRIAQEIIVGQQQEITAMRQAIGEPAPPSVPPSDQPLSGGRGAPAGHPTPMPPAHGHALATGGHT
jgi:uncharacterized protein (DUF305 family)